MPHLVPRQRPPHAVHHGRALQRRVEAGQLGSPARHLPLPKLRLSDVVLAAAGARLCSRRRRPPPLGAEEAQVGLAVLRGHGELGQQRVRLLRRRLGLGACGSVWGDDR